MINLVSNFSKEAVLMEQLNSLFKNLHPTWLLFFGYFTAISGSYQKCPNSSDLATRCCRVAMVSSKIKNVFNMTFWL